MKGRGVIPPTPHQVWQRDAADHADIRFTTAEPVTVRVLRGREAVVPWKESRGVIPGVPTGGPYTVEIRTPAGDTRKSRGIMVGDLWVLAGQSNMDGSAKPLNMEAPSRMVNCFYYSEQWDTARDPLCVLADSIDPVHWPCGEDELPEARMRARHFGETGAGLGVRFGKELNKATGVPIGLIICSHGGTSMEQWAPEKKHPGGQSLFGSMARRVKACGGKVRGMLWYQGESDANPEACSLFKQRLVHFIAACRDAFGEPAVPFIQVQIARVFADEAAFPAGAWNTVQQAQLEVSRELENVETVAAIDGTLDDAIHLDAVSLRRLGARLAEMARVAAYSEPGPRTLRPGPVRFTDKYRSFLRVEYESVRGRLLPARGVRGFTMWTADDTPIAVAKASAEGKRVTLEFEKPVPEGAALWYGRGLNPTVNLHDETFAAPVWGPVKV